MKIKKAVWLPSPDNLKRLDFEDVKTLEAWTHLVEPNLDMTDSGWVRVGEAEVTYTKLATPAEISEGAVKAVNLVITQLRADTEMKLTAMERLKQELLCLELSEVSPATVDADEADDDDDDDDDEPSKMFVEIYPDEDFDFRDEYRCLKTGCGMLFEDLQFWGDLFRDPSTGNYAFNATSTEGSFQDWIPESTPHIEIYTGTTLRRSGLVSFISPYHLIFSESLVKFLNEQDAL